MSRWGKPRKNKKFIDPRYFMDEKTELAEARLPAWERPGYVPEDPKEIEAQAIADMDVGIARVLAQDVVEYVRREIVPEQAPALAGMSMGDLLRLAADIAGDEPMAGEETPPGLENEMTDLTKRATRGD